MLGTDVVVRKTFDVGFLTNGGNGDEKPKSLLGQIADNTQETVNILRTAVLGPSQQDLRDEGISEGDTDPPKAEGGGRFRKALKGIGGALDKVNPFSSNFMFGNIGRVLLAGGGLLLINTFRENLIGPLASLLETIKKADIGTKISDTAILIKDKGVDIFTGIKDNTILFIENAKKVFGLIEGAYKAVEAYVMSFDVKGTEVQGPAGKMIEVGDNIIDDQELDALKDDLKDKAIKAITGFFKDLMLAIGGAIIAGTFIKTTLDLAMKNPALIKIFSGKSITSAFATQAALRAGTLVPIAGLLLYGITTTYMNITDSIAKTIEEEGEFKFGSFLANFFGGGDEGGIFNALKQAFKVGGTFALAGMAIGMAVTSFTGPGMLIGALVGGLVGTAVGAVIGLFTGYLGSDKLKEFGTYLKDTIDSAIDYVKNFFANLVNDVKRLLGFQTDPDLDLTKAQKDVKEAKELLATNPDYMPYKKKLEKAEKRLEDELAAQPLKQAEAAAGITMEGIEAALTQEKGKLGTLTGQLSLITPATDFKDPVSGLTKSEEIQLEIDATENQIRILEAEKIKLQNAVAANTSKDMKIDVPKTANKINETNMMGAGNSMPFINNVSGNKTNSDNTAVTNNNLGGMTVGNPDYETEVLVKGIR